MLLKGFTSQRGRINLQSFSQNVSSASASTTRILQTQPHQVSSPLAAGTATSVTVTLGATTSLAPAASATVVSQVRISDGSKVLC